MSRCKGEALGNGENHCVAQGCARLAQGYAQGVRTCARVHSTAETCTPKSAQGWRKVGARFAQGQACFGGAEPTDGTLLTCMLHRACMVLVCVCVCVSVSVCVRMCKCVQGNLCKTLRGARWRKVGARFCARAAWPINNTAYKDYVKTVIYIYIYLYM